MTDKTEAGAATAPAGEPDWRAIDALCDSEPLEADIELARLRLRQANERLEARYPRVARDAQLASILVGLGDALGAGPEASEPYYQEAQKTDIWRKQLSPVLWVVVEASANVVLELTTPNGRVVARPLVSAVELGGTLGHAAMFSRAATDAFEEARRCGPDEKRRAEGKLTKREAVEWLAGHGVSRNLAANIANSLREHPKPPWTSPDGEAMTHDGTYWVVPASAPESGD